MMNVWYVIKQMFLNGQLCFKKKNIEIKKNEIENVMINKVLKFVKIINVY